MSFGHWHHHTAVVDQDDAQPTAEGLMKLTKAKLIEGAEEEGIVLSGDETKADIVAAILAKF